MKKSTFLLFAFVALFCFSASPAQARNRSHSHSSVFFSDNSFSFGFSLHSGDRRYGNGSSFNLHLGNGGNYYTPFSPRYYYPSAPNPNYRNHCHDCGYCYECGRGPAPTITIRVRETYVDQWGDVYLTGRVLVYTAWYDPAYGAYVYRDRYGRFVVVD